MNISLTPELESFVTARVSSGRYQSATVRAEIQRKIAVGLEQARRGELLDGEAVFDELDRQDGV